MIGKGKCNYRFIWNLSITECECDESCNFEEFYGYANCKCRKKLTDKLVLECEDQILNTIEYNRYYFNCW